MTNVADDANDCCSRVPVEELALDDGVDTGPQFPRRPFVDQHPVGRIALLREPPPLFHWNAHDFEVVGVDPPQVQVHGSTLGRTRTIDNAKAIAGAVAAERQHLAGRRLLQLRHRRKRREHPAVQHAALRVGRRSGAWRYRESEEALGREARIHRSQLHEAADEQAGDAEHDDRERNFSADEPG